MYDFKWKEFTKCDTDGYTILNYNSNLNLNFMNVVVRWNWNLNHVKPTEKNIAQFN